LSSPADHPLQADGETRSRICGLKHQKEKRSMEHFAGLDVSVKDTSVCVVDDAGKIVREVKVASEPAALLADSRRRVAVRESMPRPVFIASKQPSHTPRSEFFRRNSARVRKVMIS
jgi:hypothetical protein